MEEEEGAAAEEQEGGETEGPGGGSEGGNENDNVNGRGGKDDSSPLRLQTYKEAVKKYCLHHTDNDMVGRFTQGNKYKSCFKSNKCNGKNTYSRYRQNSKYKKISQEQL